MEIDLKYSKINRMRLKKLSLIKNGDCGHFGKVYLLNEEECIKIFEDPLSENMINRLNEQTYHSFETVEMPKRLVKSKKDYIGYITNYINGVRVSDCLDFDFSKFLELYSKFIKQACLEISQDKYLIVDGGVNNIMFDKNNTCFKLVDTDLWELKEKMDYKKLRDENFTELSNSVFNRFLFLLGYDTFKLTIDDDFVDYYESVKESIEKRNNVKIKKLGDVRKIWR